MKMNFKKIAASVSAAVLCAVPMMNAVSANATASNPKYTYRSVLFIYGNSRNAKSVSYNYSSKKSGATNPTYRKGDFEGTHSGNGSAGDSYYSCGGIFTASGNFNAGGRVLTISAKTDSASFTEGTKTAKVYNAAGTQISVNTYWTPAFMVGDLNGDKKVDGSDYSYLHEAVFNCHATEMDLNSRITVFGKSIPVYEFDIDNNGFVGMYDLTLLSQKNKAGSSLFSN